MASEVAPAAREETRREEIALGLWQAPDELAAADALHQALLATSCFSGLGPEKHHELLLREMLALFRAERAFLFEVGPDSSGGIEVGGALASLDIDGDPVAHPERKVPKDLLVEAASTGMPVLRRPAGSDPTWDPTGALLALPAMSRQSALAIVVFENRFRELSISRESVGTALLYCRSLGGHLDLVRVAGENECLWTDLARLREQGGAGVGPAPAEHRVPRTVKRRREGLRGDYSLIVGSSPKMLEVLEVIDRISGSTAPVLINGESGTGKELAALAVHKNSPRKDRVFVSENCAAITETLLESELFGYVKGAFTGATKDHKGLFELAESGTLFLDEVGDMSPSMQKKLLRVLQEGVIRRVGAKDFTPVDVRIISATNKDLLEECRAGRFREDLYYRLNVIHLVLPPLRERRDDIPELVEFFLDAITEEHGVPKRLDAAALDCMVEYAWPGNIRELQNELRKLVALADSDTIQVQDLSEPLRRTHRGPLPGQDWARSFARMTLREATELLEQELIRAALDESGGNKSLVAKTLQIPKTSLYNKIHKYRL